MDLHYYKTLHAKSSSFQCEERIQQLRDPRYIAPADSSTGMELTALMQRQGDLSAQVHAAADHDRDMQIAADRKAKEASHVERKQAFIDEAHVMKDSKSDNIKAAGERRLQSIVNTDLKNADNARDIERAMHKRTAIKFCQDKAAAFKVAANEQDLSQYSHSKVTEIKKTASDELTRLNSVTREVEITKLDNWDKLPDQYKLPDDAA